MEVSLAKGSTASRRGLVEEILRSLGMTSPVPAEPEDLGELDRYISAQSLSRLALVQFDLVAQRTTYGVDLFAALRYLVMESRKLVLLVQSRRPFAALLIRRAGTTENLSRLDEVLSGLPEGDRGFLKDVRGRHPRTTGGPQRPQALPRRDPETPGRRGYKWSARSPGETLAKERKRAREVFEARSRDEFKAAVKDWTCDRCPCRMLCPFWIGAVEEPREES